MSNKGKKAQPRIDKIRRARKAIADGSYEDAFVLDRTVERIIDSFRVCGYTGQPCDAEECVDQCDLDRRRPM